jgi:hypothetical protein
MKQIITNLFFVLSPFSLLSQTVADTSFLVEKSADEFYEFFWQNELEITHDSTLYYFNPKTEINRLEVINSSNEIIWDSKSIKPTLAIPSQLIREEWYRIRMYGMLGVTEVIWFP